MNVRLGRVTNEWQTTPLSNSILNYMIAVARILCSFLDKILFLWKIIPINYALVSAIFSRIRIFQWLPIRKLMVSAVERLLNVFLLLHSEVICGLLLHKYTAYLPFRTVRNENIKEPNIGFRFSVPAAHRPTHKQRLHHNSGWCYARENSGHWMWRKPKI